MTPRIASSPRRRWTFPTTSPRLTCSSSGRKSRTARTTISGPGRPGAVRQLRVVVQAAFSGEGEAEVIILKAGQATLEIANPAQVQMIDQVEVGRPISPPVRLAVEGGEKDP